MISVMIQSWLATRVPGQAPAHLVSNTTAARNRQAYRFLFRQRARGALAAWLSIAGGLAGGALHVHRLWLHADLRAIGEVLGRSLDSFDGVFNPGLSPDRETILMLTN